MYCGNNPVARADNGGQFWNIVIGAVVGGLVSGITTAIDSYKTTGSVNWTKVGISTAVGAISGGVAATGLVGVAQAAITAFATFAGDVATQVFCEGKSLYGENQVDYLKAAWNAGVATVSSFAGSMLGKVTSAGYTSIGDDLLNNGKDKLLSGYIRQSLGQSHSQLLRQGQVLVAAGKKMINIGRGISSVGGTLFTWGFGVKFMK